MDESYLMTVPQLAKKLAVSTKTAWRLIHQRRIGFHKVGRRITVSQTQLNQYLQKTEVVPIDAEAVARQIIAS